MTLEQRIITLAQTIGADTKLIYAAIGALADLETVDKSSTVAAINEVRTLATGGTTQADVDASIADLRAEILGGAGAAYDTFQELEALLQADDTLQASLVTAVANRVRFDAPQNLTAAQKLQAGENLGIGNPDRDFAAEYNIAKA